GFGLSYTTFEYSALKIDPKEENNQGLVNVSADIQNTGKMAGDEVAELYIHEKTNSVIEYQEQLRGFERIHLEPGEKRTVSFTLKPDDLAILDRNMNWTVEPGEFEVKVGSSSEDIRLHDTFLVK
ncbi:MAG: fibronectin type III-like domain-contianing protein, partial [Bacteroidota bacterium]|nr:fibronectin type III-like domain-contianing protein [Bacteroidota bacterium]